MLKVARPRHAHGTGVPLWQGENEGARMKVKVYEHGGMGAGGQKKGRDGNNVNIQRNAIQKYSSIARGRSGKDLEREMNAFVHRQAEMKGKIVYL